MKKKYFITISNSAMCTVTPLLLLIFSQIVLIKTTNCLRCQKFTLYDDYSGTTENYTTNVRDLTKVSKIVRSKTLGSICSQTGVWAFFIQENYQDSSSFGYHPATPNWSCNERRVSAYNSPYKSIRHLGSSDLDEPGISLYSEPLFAEDELYFSGDALSLASPFQVRSFGFTGCEDWTLFTNPGFTGDAICLCCTKNGRNNSNGTINNNNENDNGTDESNYESFGRDLSGVTFEERMNFRVGSMRRTCFGSQVWLIDGQYRRPQQILNEPPFNSSHQVNGVSFYPSPSDSPSPWLYFMGKALNLPKPETFANFRLPSPEENWLVFPEMDFKGDSICLISNSTRTNVSFTVGSIKAGCELEDNDEDELSTLTPTTIDYESESTTPTIDNESESTTPTIGGNVIRDRAGFYSGSPGSITTFSPGRRGKAFEPDGSPNGTDTEYDDSDHDHDHADHNKTAIEQINDFYNKSKNTAKEKIASADSSSIFFTAFIITLILLILCILLGFGIFVYFRSSARKGNEVMTVSQPNSHVASS